MFEWSSGRRVKKVRAQPPAQGRGSWLLAVLGACLLFACGESPESVISGRWREQHWRYEKFDGHDPKRAAWIDDLTFPETGGRIVQHEAEYWEFKPGGELVISRRDGSDVHARWRLKGRGHVLSVSVPGEDGVELFDVKELNADQLVLHYDIGMEVRGIAQLTFGRFPEARADAKPVDTGALGALQGKGQP